MKRYSKKREKILATLQKIGVAASVKTLHTMLPDIDPVTIYRNVDAFAQEGIVKKLHLNNTEALYEYQQHPHHHAVCTNCEKIIHFKAPDEKIKKLLGLKDFQVREFEIIVRGTCNHK